MTDSYAVEYYYCCNALAQIPSSLWNMYSKERFRLLYDPWSKNHAGPVGTLGGNVTIEEKTLEYIILDTRYYC